MMEMTTEEMIRAMAAMAEGAARLADRGARADERVRRASEAKPLQFRRAEDVKLGRKED